MKVLDLFAGLKGWSQPFADRGHEIFTVDYDKKFTVDLHANIMNLRPEDLPWRPDIILASPPCEKFSVMRIGTNWNTDNTPKTQGASDAVALVRQMRNLITELKPTYYIIENPVGKLRKLSVMDGLEPTIITYCQYGIEYMKPTDLWGVFPPSLILKPRCKNGNPDHISAPRGAKIGVQENFRDKFRGGMIEDMIRLYSTDPRRLDLKALRSKIPYELALDVCLAAEKDLGDFSDF